MIYVKAYISVYVKILAYIFLTYTNKIENFCNFAKEKLLLRFPYGGIHIVDVYRNC